MGQGHRDLLVWQKAMDLAEKVYGLTGTLPGAERYGFVSQLNRAAVSVPSNIAEGYGRGGGDYGRFVAVAYGSLLEVETQVELAMRVGLVRSNEGDPILLRTAELGRMLNGLRGSLRRSRDS